MLCADAVFFVVVRSYAFSAVAFSPGTEATLMPLICHLSFPRLVLSQCGCIYPLHSRSATALTHDRVIWRSLGALICLLRSSYLPTFLSLISGALPHIRCITVPTSIPVTRYLLTAYWPTTQLCSRQLCLLLCLPSVLTTIADVRGVDVLCLAC